MGLCLISVGGLEGCGVWIPTEVSCKFKWTWAEKVQLLCCTWCSSLLSTLKYNCHCKTRYQNDWAAQTAIVCNKFYSPPLFFCKTFVQWIENCVAESVEKQSETVLLKPRIIYGSYILLSSLYNFIWKNKQKPQAQKPQPNTYNSV